MTKERVELAHRALTKIALECAWIDLGEERLLSSDFDRERRIVLEGGHEGYLICPKQGEPQDLRISLTYHPMVRNADKAHFLGMVASFWGFILVTDTLNPRPLGDVPEELAIIYPFGGPA
jgi:hypothetical protein